MTAATVLRTAAARVRKGWTRGVMGDKDGDVCALGALTSSAIAQNDPNYQNTYTVALAALRADIGGGSVIVWNDAPCQTAENVALTMERAAEKLEAKS